jgi:hypothetical protein
MTFLWVRKLEPPMAGSSEVLLQYRLLGWLNDLRDDGMPSVRDAPPADV